MSLTVTDLAALIQACAAGDRSALKAIMTQEGGRMLGVARRMLRRLDLAEDAVQETLVLVWRKADQFDAGRGQAKAWLYTILRNRCLTQLRGGDREILLEPGDAETAPDGAVLEMAYNRLERTHDLRICLETLEPSKRMAILSSYILGYSHGEIAGRMNAPLGSVKAWVRRGLLTLRECLS
ncbi:sigma-70 family RNA polymerase sigma factor [Phaeovulum sp. W22_SRMD_FR3]|uniref:sigma-70 family RNA polymerase sigma factor n=1 Tax=Phaeovulum sp. W22_SRMD_FR3 TaxID=3240274 RepID=UPI003F97D4D2